MLFGVNVSASANDTLPDKTPSDVYQKLSNIKSNIDLIAKHMGITPPSCINYQIRSASPREVYFQAVQLKNKTHRLQAEITGKYHPQTMNISLPVKSLSPNDVFSIMSTVNENISIIMNHLRLKDAEAIKTKKSTPSDVYEKLLVTNQLVSELLEQKILPVDTYMTTTLSIYYTGKILSMMPGVNPTVSIQEIYNNKTPYDVFDKQIEIIHVLKKIAALLNIDMLTIEPNECKLTVESDNTLDLSYLILSEIAYIASKKGILIDNIYTYHPEKKYPSDVFYRNQILLIQLNKMFNYISNYPTWSKDN